MGGVINDGWVKDGGMSRRTDVKEDGGNSLLRAATANQLCRHSARAHTFNPCSVT